MSPAAPFPIFYPVGKKNMKTNHKTVSAHRNTNDRLFRFIFGSESHKEWTLSLYNAVNKSSYSNPDDITITTIEDVVYMSMKNDLSFLIADTMNFYEQQSTFNPNIPIRMLTYAGMVYNSYMEKNRLNKYSPVLKHLPAPKLICFYNGASKKEERSILRLSDSFGAEDVSDLEAKVLMLNINYGCNKELLEACRPLADYSLFVETVRKYIREDSDKGEAVRRAIDALSEDSELRRFLKLHEKEVSEMCLSEYNESEEHEMLKQEFLEIGRAEGLKKGRKMEAERMGSLISRLIKDKRISDVDRASTDAAYRESLYKEFNL